VKEKITTSELIRGIKSRIPNSKMLQGVYHSLEANPILVEWVEAAAVQPVHVGAFHVLGFKNLLSQITFADIVQDAQIYFCNLEWPAGCRSL